MLHGNVAGHGTRSSRRNRREMQLSADEQTLLIVAGGATPESRY
jgi:hypothetical protein